MSDMFDSLEAEMAALRRELEAAKGERDAAVEQATYWRERAVGAESERDALAAHVENLNAHAEACANELATMIDRYNVQSMEDGSWTYDHQTPWELMSVVRQTPETSLARQKAQWQAEALESFRKSLPRSTMNLSPIDLMLEANRLRRQAEEAP